MPGLMNGPSRCAPMTRAAPGLGWAMASAMPSSATRSASAGAVTVVARSDVVPCRAWKAAMARTASAPSITSALPPPWTCRSTKPGRMNWSSGAVASGKMAWMVAVYSMRPWTQPSGVRILPRSVCITGCAAARPQGALARRRLPTRRWLRAMAPPPGSRPCGAPAPPAWRCSAPCPPSAPAAPAPARS